MKNSKIKTNKKSLELLFSKAGLFASDQEALSNWAKYLCVCVYGYLENSFTELLASYASKRAQQPIANFVRAKLDEIWKWDEERLLAAICKFDGNLRVELERKADPKFFSSLNSVTTNRNKISHGESVNITLAQITTYFSDVNSLLDLLEKELGL